MDEHDREMLIRVDAKVAELGRLVEHHNASHNDIEARLRQLERWQWRTTGIAAAAAIIGSAILAPVVRALLGTGG